MATDYRNKSTGVWRSYDHCARDAHASIAVNQSDASYMTILDCFVSSQRSWHNRGLLHEFTLLVRCHCRTINMSLYIYIVCAIKSLKIKTQFSNFFENKSKSVNYVSIGYV